MTEDERLEIARANAADMELYEYALQLLHVYMNKPPSVELHEST